MHDWSSVLFDNPKSYVKSHGLYGEFTTIRPWSSYENTSGKSNTAVLQNIGSLHSEQTTPLPSIYNDVGDL